MIHLSVRVYGYVSLNLLKLGCPQGSSMYLFRIISLLVFIIFFRVPFWYSYSIDIVVIPSVEQPFVIFKPHYVTNAF